MENNIRERTDPNYNFPNQGGNNSLTNNLMSLDSSGVQRHHNRSSRQDRQIFGQENSAMTFPSHQLQDHSTFRHQNKNAIGYQHQGFQTSFPSSNFTKYPQDYLQVNDPSSDYNGYEHAEGYSVATPDHYHKPNYKTDQHVPTSGYLSESLTHEHRSSMSGGHQSAMSGGHQSAMSGGHQSAMSGGHQSATLGGLGQEGSALPNVVHNVQYQRELETLDHYLTKSSTSMHLLPHQNVTEGAPLPNYSLTCPPLHTISTTDPLLADPYGHQPLQTSVPASREDEGGLDRQLQVAQAGYSSSSTQQQASLPQFQDAFGLGSDLIPDSSIAFASATDTNSQKDFPVHQNRNYTNNSFEITGSFCNLFDNQALCVDVDTMSSVGSTLVDPSSRLHEPFGVGSLGSSSIDSSLNEMSDNLNSEALYSPYSIGTLDSPNSEAHGSPYPESQGCPDTPSPSGSGAVPKQFPRAPRKTSTCSSASSHSSCSSAISSGSSTKSKSKKEKQRHRLTNAEYEAMSPEIRKERDQNLNKIASQKSREKTQKKRVSKDQFCSALKSDHQSLNDSERGLENSKKAMISALMANTFTRQSIIDKLRANGASESMIMNLFSDFEE